MIEVKIVISIYFSVFEVIAILVTEISKMDRGVAYHGIVNRYAKSLGVTVTFLLVII